MAHHTYRKANKKFGKDQYISIIVCCLLLCAIFFFFYAFSYFEGLSYRFQGYPTYSGVCAEYQKTYKGKSGGYRLTLRLDDREFGTQLEKYISHDFYDEIQEGDELTVSYIPKQRAVIFRNQNLLISIGKNGKEYLDTSAVISTYYANGWFCIGFGMVHLFTGAGLLIYKKKVKRR